MWVGGGHTKIFLSEEGTIWPEEPKNPNEKPGKRWSIDGLQLSTAELKPPSVIKAARFRYLAQLAQAYRSKQIVRELPLPPQELWRAIHAAVGIIEWINKDSMALEASWNLSQIKRMASGICE